MEKKNYKFTETSKRALYHLRLEGITPSSSLLADMELLDNVKISNDEFIERGISRATLINFDKKRI